MTNYTDLIARLNNGWVARPKRWSGDTHHDFPYGNLDDEATDLLMTQAADAIEAAQAEIERLTGLAGGYANENMRLSAERDAALARLAEIEGCFRAAESEGLTEVLENTQDERLKDLVERRLMHALFAAAGASPVQPSQAVEPPRFPTMLRKMWSGGEVQDWINANWNAAINAKESGK